MTGEANVFADLFSRIMRADGAQLLAIDMERLQAFERGELTLGEVGELQTEWLLRVSQLPAPYPTGMLEFSGDLSEERVEELRRSFERAQSGSHVRVLQPPKYEVIVPVPRELFDRVVAVLRTTATSRRRLAWAYPWSAARLVLTALREAGLIAGDGDA